MVGKISEKKLKKKPANTGFFITKIPVDIRPGIQTLLIEKQLGNIDAQPCGYIQIR